MPTSNDAVLIGAPLATGAIQVAAVGTTLPTDATTAPTGFTDAGNVSDSGINFNRSLSTKDVKNWNLDVVRTLLTDAKATFDFELLQTDATTLGIIFGDGNVTETSGKVKVSIKNELPGRRAWVFSMKDGDNRVRFCIAEGEVTNYKQVGFTKSGEIKWGITVTAYGVGGKSADLYVD